MAVGTVGRECEASHRDQDLVQLLSEGAFESVLRTCKERLLADNRDAPAFHYAAIALRKLDDPKAALDFHAMALQRAPMRPDFHFELGSTFMGLRLWTDAANAYDVAAKLSPSETRFKVALADCLVESAHPESLTKIEDMLCAHPSSAELHHLKGAALFAQGLKTEAQAAAMTAWKLGRRTGATLFSLVKYSDTGALENLRPMFDPLFRSGGKQSDHMLYFAKAELEHRLRNYEEAHWHYCRGNALAAEHAHFDMAMEEKAETEMLTLFRKDLPKAPAPKEDSPTPIFIVGMPRSGSTLCETLLAAHGQAKPLGEIGEIVSAVRRLKKLDVKSPIEALIHIQDSYLASGPVRRAGTSWIIDKYLGNFFYIGHILHAFPNAKILHIHRDPKATAWSIFRQWFAKGQVGFAYRPKDILGFYGMYVRMMAFWESQFSGQIIHLSYEQLVQDPAATIPDLLRRLQMPWDEACLSPEKVKRIVATASAGQTTQAIYTGSSEVWRNYEPYTDGWLDQLLERRWPT